jgi:hypothetical protein
LNTYLGGNTLPDMRGQFPRGYDNGRGVDSGRALNTEQTDDFKSHQHTITASITQYGPRGGSGGEYWGAAPVATSVAATGGTETRPKNRSLIFAIRS